MQNNITFVCGANGIGKSTYSSIINTNELEVIDPDKIAFSEQLSPIEAGKEASKRAKNNIKNKISFIRESTLSSNFDFLLLDLAKKNNYTSNLIYIGIKSPEICIYRINERVSLGGHFVPKEDVQRRYQRSLNNILKATALFDNILFIDNSTNKYEFCLEIKNRKVVNIFSLPQWLHTSLHIPNNIELNNNIIKNIESNMNKIYQELNQTSTLKR